MLVAVLHDIRSVHNVGSIFRTADGAGFSKIYCCGVTPAPFDRFGRVRPDMAKVALGAERSVACEHRASALALLRKLKGEGYKIIAVEQDRRSMPFHGLAADRRLRKADKIAVIMGGEVKGLSSKILDEADIIAEIPMRGKKESLNVAVAFGIAAYQLSSPPARRGRRKGKTGLN